MDPLEALKSILRERAGFEVVDLSSADSQIRIVGRVPPNASSQWVLIVHHLLLVSRKAAWKVDISRNYFLRDAPSGPKLFYAWRLIFQAPNISEQLIEISSAFKNAPKPARVELQEYPLGATRNRNEPWRNNGKGAGLLGQMPLGIAAVRQGGGT
jgi:hypothetical protein